MTNHIICVGRTPQQAAIDNLGDLQLTARLTGLERENVIEARIELKKLDAERTAILAENARLRDEVQRLQMVEKNRDADLQLATGTEQIQQANIDGLQHVIRQCHGMADSILKCLLDHGPLPKAVHPHEFYDLANARGWALSIMDITKPTVDEARAALAVERSAS